MGDGSWTCPRCRNLNAAGQASCWFCQMSAKGGDDFAAGLRPPPRSVVRAVLLSVGVLFGLGLSVFVAVFVVCAATGPLNVH